MRDLSHAKGRRSIWIDLLLYPTHTLPTYSVEEAAEFEIALMQRGQKSKPGTFGVRPPRRGEEDDVDEDEAGGDDDAAVDKARKWDDWKDQNPTGAGNSKLRPCAQ